MLALSSALRRPGPIGLQAFVPDFESKAKNLTAARSGLGGAAGGAAAAADATCVYPPLRLVR